jgi:hypothetical protein
LRELEEKELIKCSTESRKGKIYKLTDRGYHTRRFLASFIEREFFMEIMKALDEREITYAKNAVLEGGVTEYRPDLVVFKREKPVLIMEILTMRPSQRRPKMFLERPLENLAFRFLDLRKINREIKM